MAIHAEAISVASRPCRWTGDTRDTQLDPGIRASLYLLLVFPYDWFWCHRALTRTWEELQNA